MLYNVAQLLKESIGASRKLAIEGDLYNLDENNPGPVRVTGALTLIRIEHGILACGSASLTLAASCRRCLELVGVDVEFEFEEEYVPSIDVISGVQLPRTEDDSPELLIDDHHILDLTEVVRQYVVTEGASAALCRVDCRGLCPQCGQNLNLGECACDRSTIDPRLEILGQLLDTDE
jgi:uncharacterized protein